MVEPAAMGAGRREPGGGESGSSEARQAVAVPTGARVGLADRATPSASVGLVHDYLLVMRGAERTFSAMASCWPQAPIYTLLYDSDGTDGRFEGRSIHTSYLQRLGVGQGGFRRLLPLFPSAAQRLPVAGHDVVVSSSSAFAHGVRVGADAVHVCYCHTPFRYAWHERRRTIAATHPALRPMLGLTLRYVRRWDVAASRRVTHYIAVSELSKRRIEEAYGREASVIHPPVETGRFEPAEPEDYFLVVAELVRHKEVDTALEAARRAGKPMRVVGTGPDFDWLRRRYGQGAEFLGRVDDRELASLYARAQALVIPNIEEFGITAVEAQAAGRPVVAADGGGARETVREGETGVFVRHGDVDALAEALRYTDYSAFSRKALTEHANRFSEARFRARLRREVERVAGGGA